MALTTFDELADYVASTIRETQINSLIRSFLNLTQQEIWGFHPWTFKRRKTTFATVASQETYVLDEEIDQIRVLRQRTSPTKLLQVPDPLFYALQPDPEGGASGHPRLYRLWEETGFKAQLTAAGTVGVVSSSTSDGSAFTVRIIGRNSSDEVVAETLTLNGTTTVTSATSWAVDGLLQVSKSAQTTGTLTVSATTGGATVAELAPEDLAPRYKRISLYPIPSAVITMYLEYDERLRLMVHDADAPQLDKKWVAVLLDGTFAKAWEYKQNERLAAQHQALFDRGLRLMVREDSRNMDYVPALQPRQAWPRGVVKRYGDSVNNALPSYGVGWS